MTGSNFHFPVLISCCVIVLAYPTAIPAQQLTPQSGEEARLVDEIRARALSELKARYPEGGQVLVRRDAHAKAHGCVKAIFIVDADIPEELRIGTFSQPAQQFRTFIRYSNAAFEPGADSERDVRGMAIKILDAEPRGDSQSRGRPPHDLLMVNYPGFFSPNVADYRDFVSAGALTGNSDGLRRYFFPSLNPWNWRMHQLYVALEATRQPASSPLSLQYYSMVPFMFGSGRAVKYSARPCAEPLPVGPSKGADFLREALWKTLASGPACFELLVQERKDNMDVENALIEWSEAVSPYRRVGKIEVPSGQINTDAREKACESLTFNPWNAPAEQQPLGGINRVRKAVYESISGYRSMRNNVTPFNPTNLWTNF